MADRKDYYFEQPVTESELDDGFEGLEVADRNIAIDHALTKVVSGLGVTQHAPTNTTVDVAIGVAYSKAGERISVPSIQNVNVAVDDLAASTDVATPGNERWVSVFVVFDRTLSDPRIDGNAVSVYFDRAESFEFSVVSGAEAAIGTAVRPSLAAGKILLADINRTNGVSAITNAAISVTRREDAYRYLGTVLSYVAGNPRDALTLIADALDSHLSTANAHAAAAIDYAGSSPTAFADTTVLAAQSVESAIDTLVNLLGSTGAGVTKIGAPAIAQAPTSLSAGTLASQVSALLTAINARAALTLANTFTNTNTFSGLLNLRHRIQNLGEDLIGTGGNALLARVTANFAPNAVASRTLMFEFDASDGGLKWRIYAYNDGSGYTSLEITFNALWGGATWTSDDSGNVSTKFSLSHRNASLGIAPATGATFADSVFNNGLSLIANDGTQINMLVNDGGVDFRNVTTSGSLRTNPSKNVLTAKKIVDAWLMSTAPYTIDDEVGIASLVTDGLTPNSGIVTFDHSADAASQQAIFVTPIGSATGRFPTISSITVNTVKVRLWTDTATDVDVSGSNGFCLMRMARIS